jgi:8-oxo-dGTP pyrophosphatase MutT (NUDIX family)
MYSNTITSPGARVKAGVGVVIEDDQGRILLEQRCDNGMWGLPGGGIEPGESILDTAVREVKEETGLDIRIKGLLGVYSDPAEGRIVTYPDNGDVAQLVDTVLIAKRMAGRLTMSRESLELDFFHPDALPTNIAPPAMRPIRDFLAKKKGIIA